MTAPTMTPAALATELGTDSRTCRAFLRSITPKDDRPGKGGRWEIAGTKTSINSLKKSFAKYQQDRAESLAARAKDAAEAAAKGAETDEDSTEEVTETE